VVRALARLPGCPGQPPQLPLRFVALEFRVQGSQASLASFLSGSWL
jgi:hypothetical protein